ncbi:MAG: histidine phosphatase family protein [Elusimicrobia bacterium]|nr:histidine phosphatase family protein [Elusimicrobiota bacterium]
MKTAIRRAAWSLAAVSCLFAARRAAAGEVAAVRLEDSAVALSGPASAAAGADQAPAPTLSASPALSPAPAPAPLAAGPAQIVIIRHAEKPAQGSDLSPRGYQRAQALVGLFKTDPDLTRYGAPAAIYAQKPTQDGTQIRPLETVQPLAESLGLTVNTDFRKPDAEGLARTILSDPSLRGKMVLISWEHHMIPAIARALGLTDAPDAWPDAAFDRLWIIDFDGGRPVAFRNLPQRLLPGDSAQ